MQANLPDQSDKPKILNTVDAPSNLRAIPAFFFDDALHIQKQQQNKTQGWVSVYRSLMYSEIWKNPFHVKAFLYLLFRAQYQESPGPFGQDDITLLPGQILTSQKRMEADTDLTREQVRRFFSAIKLHRIATIKTTKKWTVVTLIHWDFYQNHEVPATNKKTKAATNKQPRGNHQTTIYNNKQVNNEEYNTIQGDGLVKENIIYPFDTEIFKTEWLRWKKYKKDQFRFTYKSEDSENAALADLNRMAGSNQQNAIQLINLAIAKSWKGFYELKTNNYATNPGNVKQSKDTSAERLADQLAQHIASANSPGK